MIHVSVVSYTYHYLFIYQYILENISKTETHIYVWMSKRTCFPFDWTYLRFPASFPILSSSASLPEWRQCRTQWDVRNSMGLGVSWIYRNNLQSWTKISLYEMAKRLICIFICSFSIWMIYYNVIFCTGTMHVSSYRYTKSRCGDDRIRTSSNIMYNCNAHNTLGPKQDGRHFPDDIFKCIFLNENV